MCLSTKLSYFLSLKVFPTASSKANFIVTINIQISELCRKHTIATVHNHPQLYHCSSMCMYTVQFILFQHFLPDCLLFQTNIYLHLVYFLSMFQVFKNNTIHHKHFWSHFYHTSNSMQFKLVYIYIWVSQDVWNVVVCGMSNQ